MMAKFGQKHPIFSNLENHKKQRKSPFFVNILNLKKQQKSPFFHFLNFAQIWPIFDIFINLTPKISITPNPK